MTRFAVAFVALCLIAEPARLSTQQTSPPVFATKVNLSLVDFRVVDRNGTFVSDLTQADVRVFEDDTEQAIANFSLVEVPHARPASSLSAVASDVASNARTEEGRLYLIVLDKVPSDKTPMVRALTHGFVEDHMTDGDQAALVTIAGRSGTTQEFTHDRRRLLNVADGFEGDFGADDIDRARTLTSLVKWLADIPGRRKSIVFITDNVNSLLNTPGRDGSPPDVAPDLNAFLQASARGNVTVYVVDPTGVPGGTVTGLKAVPRSTTPGDFMESAKPAGGSALMADEIRRQGLRVFAEATGGLAFGTTSNDFAAAFDRIVDDSSSYYILGYESKSAPTDGKFHKIRVEVTRPRLRVRSRTGFQAPKAPAKNSTNASGVPRELADLLKSPIDVTGLTLSVTATPFLGRVGRASVAVVVEARPTDVQFSLRDARFNGSLNVAIVAGDLQGFTAASESGSLTMRLSPETRETALKQGVRILSSLNLRPGRYHLKIAAGDGNGKDMRGVVQYDITVPDFSKGDLAVSGVALGSVAASRTPTSGSIDRWKQTLGMSPTTTRVFTSTDELRAYSEIYDSDSRPDHRVNVMTVVRTVSGETVFSRAEEMPRSRGTTTHRSMTEISLKNFASGDYVLSVEVRNELLKDQPSVRQVPFTVE